MFPSFLVCLFKPVVGSMSNGAHTSGVVENVAWRRRQRRLRAVHRFVWWAVRWRQPCITPPVKMRDRVRWWLRVRRLRLRLSTTKRRTRRVMEHLPHVPHTSRSFPTKSVLRVSTSRSSMSRCLSSCKRSSSLRWPTPWCSLLTSHAGDRGSHRRGAD